MNPAQIEEANRTFVREHARQLWNHLAAHYPPPEGETLIKIEEGLFLVRSQLDKSEDVRLALETLNQTRKLVRLRALELPHRIPAPSPMAALRQAVEGQAQRLGATPPGTPGQFLEVVCYSEADHEVDFRFEISTPAGVQLTRREVKEAIRALIDSKTPRVD